METNFLESVMTYHHPGLILRLQDKMKLSREEAEELFADMKRFLFLAATVSEPLAPTERIDEAWHNFILFTKDYQWFCREHFGTFIHHIPVGPDDIFSRDGSIMGRTIQAAQEVFGDGLSLNWRLTAKCSDNCSPSTNCQNKCSPSCSKECSKGTEALVG